MTRSPPRRDGRDRTAVQARLITGEAAAGTLSSGIVVPRTAGRPRSQAFAGETCLVAAERGIVNVVFTPQGEDSPASRWHGCR